MPPCSPRKRRNAGDGLSGRQPLWFGIELPIGVWSALILGIVAGLLVFGRYPALERLTKVLMLLLLAATVVAAILAAGDPGPRSEDVAEPAIWNASGIAFIVALIGWMPAPLEVAVWHSLWSVERRQQTGRSPTLRQALLDFDVGYGLTGLIALLFLALGAWVLFGTGEAFSGNAAAFTRQLVRIYTASWQ